MTDRAPDGKFIKGESGNPNGRPPKAREERYREMFNTVTFDNWQAVINKAVEQAKRGDPVARKWLSDYLVGVPAQRHELTGAEGGAIIIDWDDHDTD